MAEWLSSVATRQAEQAGQGREWAVFSKALIRRARLLHVLYVAAASFAAIYGLVVPALSLWEGAVSKPEAWASMVLGSGVAFCIIAGWRLLQRCDWFNLAMLKRLPAVPSSIGRLRSDIIAGQYLVRTSGPREVGPGFFRGALSYLHFMEAEVERGFVRGVLNEKHRDPLTIEAAALHAPAVLSASRVGILKLANAEEAPAASLATPVTKGSKRVTDWIRDFRGISGQQIREVLLGVDKVFLRSRHPSRTRLAVEVTFIELVEDPMLKIGDALEKGHLAAWAAYPPIKGERQGRSTDWIKTYIGDKNEQLFQAFAEHHPELLDEP